ncbi:MAG: universal stress protein [Pseudomonadota bacterium]|nr:universal stress protein [Pseudomonadota bacterium]
MSTEKTLIALVDGSAYSESVCHHTAWAAGRMGAGVKLYHVLGRRDAPDRQDLSGAIRLGARSRLLQELAELDEQRAKLTHAHGRAILEDAAEIVTGAGVERVETRLRQGDIVDTVTAKEETGEMIIVGKRGEAADFAKLHLGSNVERIVRASHKPVLVASRAFKPVNKVLVAFDGGATSMKALDYVARDPLFAGLSITVVKVGPENDQTTKALNDAAALLRAGGHQVETRLVSGQAEEALSDVIEKDGFDMLVMGAYGHSRVRTLIIGSTTSEMIRTCKVPVVLIR